MKTAVLSGAIVLLGSLSLVWGCSRENADGKTDPPKPTTSAPPSAPGPSVVSPIAATPSAAAIAPAAPADPLAALFGGPPDPAIKFLGIKTIKGEAVSAQYPPGWFTNRDDSSVDYVDSELQLYDKYSHAQVWLAMVPKTTTLEPDKISFNAKRVAASGATFEAPIDGTFGAGSYPAKIAKGKASVAKWQLDVWYAIVDIDPKKSLVCFASLRKDVYPKLEAEITAVMRSVKRLGK